MAIMQKGDNFRLLKCFPLFLAAQSEVPVEVLSPIIKYSVKTEQWLVFFTVEVKVHVGSLAPAKG
jgi:hypothetical protein